MTCQPDYCFTIFFQNNRFRIVTKLLQNSLEKREKYKKTGKNSLKNRYKMGTIRE